jgi:hypothetical protein
MEHTVVTNLVAPVALDEFLATYFGRKELHSSGHEGRFADWFTWRELDWLLESQRWDGPLSNAAEHPRLRLSHRRQSLPLFVAPDPRGQRPRLDVPAFYRRFREGATIVVNGADELSPRVREVAEALAATFGCHVTANLYASAGHDEGFGLHWDEHDVFVVQVTGTKEWALHGQTRKNPLSKREVVPPPTGAPLRVATMTPGDCLYLPKGYWHNVAGKDEPSLHLTFSVYNPTGVTFLRWLVDELSREEFFRADLPRFGGAKDGARWAEALRDRLLTRLGAGSVLSEFFSRNDSTLPARPHFNFAALFGAAPPERRGYRLSAQAAPAVMRDENSSSLLVSSGGREIKLPGYTALLIERLGELDVVSEEELGACTGLAGKELEPILAHLVAEGLVHEVYA